MRDMANPNDEAVFSLPPRRPSKIVRLRLWVQSAFLVVWLAPLGKSLGLRRIPSCVFHCYACPLSSLACPIGVMANFIALGFVPLMTLGILVAVGGLVGSLVCGWACPFGFLQDLAAKAPLPKLRIPNWTSCGRYLVLVALVIAVPAMWGTGHPLFICRVCPAGALEGGVYSMASQAAAGQAVQWMSAYKFVILGAFVAAIFFTFRPWCKIFCPLGGLLSLFNRFSIFHLRFAGKACTNCNLCRSRCPMGVEVEQKVNTTRCIRCLECTTCGAIVPAFGKKSDEPPIM